MALTIYTMERCPFCERAKCFLYDRGIEFKEISAPPGSREWQEMKRRTGGESLPQILIHDVSIGGYAELVNMEATGELYEKLGVPEMGEERVLYDVIIIGAGPAGLSAAIYTIRKLLKTIIISKDIGGQIAWTTDVDNYLGFSQVNADELVSKFEDHVKKFDVDKLIGVEVKTVDLATRIKRVVTLEGKSYYGKTLIIATGGRHRPLDIPGERELVGRGISYCSTCDAPLFEGVEVAVVGGGNAGLEAVIDLMSLATRIYVVSLLPISGDAVYQAKIRQSPKVEIYEEWQPIKILGDTSVKGMEIRNLKSGEHKALAVEGVFVEIGILPCSDLFLDTLATNQKGEILVDPECRTGVAGVFACGDVTTVPFKQVVVAVGEGAKAALSAYNYLMNQP